MSLWLLRFPSALPRIALPTVASAMNIAAIITTNQVLNLCFDIGPLLPAGRQAATVATCAGPEGQNTREANISSPKSVGHHLPSDRFVAKSVALSLGGVRIVAWSRRTGLAERAFRR